jgi:hypothetical protein
MTPADNILYFNNNIDIRLCLKNAFTTFRAVWVSCYDKDHCIDYYTGKRDKIIVPGALDRYKWAMRYQDIWDQPFRRGSYRIAVKRDPVERFVSAVSYLNNVKLSSTYAAHKKSYIDLSKINKDDTNSIIDALDNQTLRDEHFFSQTYFMGHPDNYDKVYDITEISQLLSWLEEKVSNLNPIPFTHIWENKTKGTDQRIQLTDEQTTRIIKLYAKDYDNGWC